MTYRILIPTSLALACGIAACSESMAPVAGAGSGVTVSFSSAPGAGSASLAASMPAPRSVTVANGGDVLVIDRVQLVLSRIELQRDGASCATTAAAGDDVVDDHRCAELELAPSLVDLPVDGSVANALAVTVPSGTYTALEAQVRPLRSDGDHGSGSQAFLSAHPELAGVSVVVTGTLNGTAFTYRGAPRAELETIFSPPLAVNVTPVNLTVHADVTTWFRTQSGAVIDPSTANAGGANASLVADNIRRSFKAFRDDDHNGHDDDDHAHA